MRTTSFVHRWGLTLLGLAVAASACGGASPQGATVTGPGEATTQDPAALLRTAAELTAGLEAYRVDFVATITFALGAPGMAPGVTEASLWAEGMIDAAVDATQMSIDYSGLGAAFLEEPDEPAGILEMITVGDEMFARGVTSPLLAVADIQPDRWYRLGDGHPAIDNPLFESEVSPAQVLSAIGVPDVVEGPVVGEHGGEPVRIVSFTVPRAHWGEIEAASRRSVIDFSAGGEGAEVDVAVWIDAAGIARRIHIRIDDAEAGLGAIDILMDLDAAESPLAITAPDDALDVPAVDGEVPMALPPDRPVVRIEPDGDGVMFRAGLYAGPEDLFLTVEADGRVVKVTDRSVFSTTDHYTTWQLSPHGVERLVAVIEESGLIGHPEANLQFGWADGQNGSISFNGCCVVEVTGIGATDGLSEAQLARRRIFDEVFALVTDHGWLGDDVLSGEEPYVPDGLTILAERIDDVVAQPVAWPLPERVESLALDGAFCLYDDDVDPVFALFTGINHAHLVVDDGGELWDLTVRPQLPGYALQSERCS